MRLDSRGNVMINGTKGVQFVQESTDSINSGFDDVMKEGPLCKEQMRDCKFTFTHFVPHEDPAHRGLVTIGSCFSTCMYGCTYLTAGSSTIRANIGN